MAAVSSGTAVPQGEYRIYALTMLRNDADIIAPFLAQARELFDKLIVAEGQSTDGTREALEAEVAAGGRIEIYTVDKEEKYQSAIMNCLARKAFDEGADWIFLLDADEFLHVDGRASLQAELHAYSSDVMFLPWLNLVPEKYGCFTDFDANQTFYWRGRLSRHVKVALSSLFIARNPDFHIYEGNHHIAPDVHAPIVTRPRREGLVLLHAPIRSADRFKYKMSVAHGTLLTKHNPPDSEGTQVTSIERMLRSDAAIGVDQLNALAAHYGDDEIDAVDVADWPRIGLPVPLLQARREFRRIGLSDTIRAESELQWRRSCFVPGSPVGARIVGRMIEIVPQPLRGDGSFFSGCFEALPARPPEGTPRLDPVLIAQAVAAAFSRVEILTGSAWSELVPTMFVLFKLLNPRRFVELGTHYGMSYFSACQASKGAVQCVAIDNWIGDPHASFHAAEVYDEFRRNASKFPEQLHVRANFDDAVRCFDDGSIDLLHIDGYHTYEAVRNDFETWLAKMSPDGVIIFHDINVHERGFGVWRFWEELVQRYPSFQLMHCHGLGMIYVGGEPSVTAQIMRWLNENQDTRQIAQSFLEYVGTMSLEYRRQSEDLENIRKEATRLASVLGDTVAQRDHLATEVAAREEVAQSFLEYVGTMSLEYRRQSEDMENIRKEATRLASVLNDTAAQRDHLATEVAARDQIAERDNAWLMEMGASEDLLRANHAELVWTVLHARHRPLSTLMRHAKWRLNRAIDKLPLSRRGHEITRRRAAKSAPGAR
jgi:hypothetical protein